MTEEGESCSFSRADQWSTEKLNNLISLYSEERDLWDTTRTPSFDQRQEAYERIANSLGLEGWCNASHITSIKRKQALKAAVSEK